MATPTFIEVKKQIVRLLQSDQRLTGVTIDLAFLGQDAGRECIYFTDTRGEFSIEHLQSGRKTYDDRYTLGLNIDVIADGSNIDESETRLGELFTVVVELLADEPVLRLTEGVVTTPEPKLISAKLAGYESATAPTDQGVVSQLRLQIAAHSQLR